MVSEDVLDLNYLLPYLNWLLAHWKGHEESWITFFRVRKMVKSTSHRYHSTLLIPWVKLGLNYHTPLSQRFYVQRRTFHCSWPLSLGILCWSVTTFTGRWNSIPKIWTQVQHLNTWQRNLHSLIFTKNNHKAATIDSAWGCQKKWGTGARLQKNEKKQYFENSE